ncbi:MAG TPA: hypothetical protein VHY56_06315 [Candidatus Binataceae bacterium]|jgi:hypothetical protein|nr:hypothetical protein [Candidatus Binataceae bacterium]
MPRISPAVLRLLARLLTIIGVCLLAGLVMAADTVPKSGSIHNLLNNGDLARGSGDSCDAWRNDAWILAPDRSTFTWIAPEGGHPGELEVENLHENDARWTQTLSLTGGWYRLSVWARTEDVLPYFTGADISVLEDGIASADLKGTQPWQRLDLYLKVPTYGADVEVALRLGGYANLTRGKAFFHNPRVERISAPPAGAAHVYDLGEIRKADGPGPIGSRWTLYATFLLLAVAAVIGWRVFMLEPGPASAIGTPPAVDIAKAPMPKKRRLKKSQRRT